MHSTTNEPSNRHLHQRLAPARAGPLRATPGWGNHTSQTNHVALLAMRLAPLPHPSVYSLEPTQTQHNMLAPPSALALCPLPTCRSVSRHVTVRPRRLTYRTWQEGTSQRQ